MKLIRNSRRKKNKCWIIILLMITSMVVVADPVFACHYEIGTYESNYSTPKTSFLKGETVYGKGIANGYNYQLKLRIKDPDGNIVYSSGVSQYTVYGSYQLDASAQPGVWYIQLGIYYQNNWSWSTASGRMSSFTVNEVYYTLTANTDGNGAVVKDPDLVSYSYGSLVDVTAVADSGWSFSYWDDDLTGSDNPKSILMDSDKIVTAYFTEDQYTLTINTDGDGTVTKNPDQTTYYYGTSVELTAYADTGWTFNHWGGDLTGSSNPGTIVMDSDKSVSAYFTENQYTLSESVDGSGSVVKSPDQASYAYGSVVELSAVADPGWTFSHWSGDLSGSSNPDSLVIDGDKVVTAYFTQDEYTLTVIVYGNGTVSRNPDQATFVYGTAVELTAIADVGWSFSYWSDDLSGSNNPETIIMNNDKTVSAYFTEDQYTLSLNILGNGTVSRNPDQATYLYGTLIELTAVADAGWSFSHWTDDVSGEVNPEFVLMDDDKTVTAHFTEENYTLIIDIEGSGSVNRNPDQENYTYKSLVELTANPSSGYVFDHWSGDETGSSNPIIVNMTDSKNITAHFKSSNNGGGDPPAPPNGGGGTTSSNPNPNNPPVADLSAGEPYIGFIKEDILFNGSYSYDLDDHIVSWIWDFGDGTTDEGELVTHNYTHPGEYEVVLTVTDTKGDSSEDETLVIVVQPNRPPNAPNVSGPTSGFVNVDYTFTIVSDDDDNDVIRYTVDFGDGTIEESEYLPSGFKFNITHIWTEPGTYTINLTADDNETTTTIDFTIVIDDKIPQDDNFILNLLALLALFLLIIFLILAKRRKKDKKEEKPKKQQKPKK